MFGGILQAAGGLGLFLLGMSVMTGGLKAMADERLRAILKKSTRSPLSGVATGALATAILQSSSATTVAAVGFVHAGLLTFSQALGIIFGANIGTTVTGWLVALLGFKLQLGEVVMPFILLGALLRLIGRGRVQATGTALAGFGLIFVGVDALQSGLDVFHGVVTPSNFPGDTVVGRLELLLIGVAITLVTQSSSAGVVAALAAVHAEAISLSQAAAMVIGMDFGTTVTAAMATIGGNVQARRTGLAHVVYNAMTAAGAFILLTPFLIAVDTVFPAARDGNAELVLVAFHTCFNALGVMAILPFTKQFARLIILMFPDRGNPLTRHLDRSLLASPEVALQSVGTTLRDMTVSVFTELVKRIDEPKSSSHTENLSDVSEAVDHTRHYLQELRIDNEHPECMDLYLRSVHILDHLRRVISRIGRENRLQCVRADSELSSMTDDLLAAIEFLLSGKHAPSDHEMSFREVNDRMKKSMRDYRRITMRRAAAGELASRTALQRMDTARWLRRLVHHIMRIAHHSKGNFFQNGTN